ARLVTGETNRAIEAFVDATALDGSNAAAWSNLAAAYVEKGTANPSAAIESAIKAIDAGRRAVSLRASMPEAWFNLALAGELGFHGYAGDAIWNRYLTVETSEQWRAEATAYRSVAGAADPSINW